MARHYGIPYMGSKQKLVDKIIPFILERHPDVQHFYDLFGGGAAASLYAVRKYPNINVYYNELSKAIGSLLEYIRDGGKIPDEFISRSDFESKYTGDDWYAGLLQTCWTFGNNQKSYLYGTDIEDFKQKLSELVTTGTGDIKYLENFVNDFVEKKYKNTVNTNILINKTKYTTQYQRRIVVSRQIDQVGALQHLSRIERLQKIQEMPRIKNLNITYGLSYESVPILERERESLYIAIHLTKIQQNTERVDLITKHFMIGWPVVSILSILQVIKLVTRGSRSLRLLKQEVCSRLILEKIIIITKLFTGMVLGCR